uniref:CAZy families CE9 protein n=1 Tax=uncultured Pirellula sp. TaxID=298571 RepID=A0A060C0V9_9BACT|nr:CAZy families CE9 protein [uncultured Pirellula sp.]
MYSVGSSRFEVLETGKIVVAGQREYLAGSGVQTDVCVARMVAMTGCSLADAWAMASTNPAQFLNVEIGGLVPGAVADFVLFDHDPQAGAIRIRRTITRGETRFES